MVAKKLKIYDISDVSPTVTAGGDGMGSQVAPETEVGVFLKTLDPKLSTRYAKTLFDAGFETVRDKSDTNKSSSKSDDPEPHPQQTASIKASCTSTACIQYIYA